MTAHIYRIALIVPDAQREAANRIAEAMGWGAGCYSVPLSTDGAEPATHWGLSTSATQSFVDILEAAGTGVIPEGIDAEDISSVLPVLLVAIDPAGTPPGAQFDTLAEQVNVTRVENEDS